VRPLAPPLRLCYQRDAMNNWLKTFRQSKPYDLLVALPLIAWFGRGAWEDAKALAPHIQLLRAGQENHFRLSADARRRNFNRVLHHADRVSLVSHHAAGAG